LYLPHLKLQDAAIVDCWHNGENIQRTPLFA
jgi:hypothetical protein